MKHDHPKKARELAVDRFYRKELNCGDLADLVEGAFRGFCDLEYEDDSDEAVLHFFGDKDGKTVLEFYEKYSWDAFFDEKIDFEDTFSPEERAQFWGFEKENIEKLYKRYIWSDVLIMPITEVLSEKKR